MGQPHPRRKGAGPQRPPNFGTSYMRADSMGNSNQSLYGDQAGREENFYANADA